MKEFHERVCGGNSVPTTTAHNIIRARFYWPSIFKDSYATIRNCISCQQCFRENEEVWNVTTAYICGTTILPMGN
jgi:hypothetical protein